MDDAELQHIDACKRGHLEEFDPLYTQHVDAVYRYLQRRTLSKAVAEDLTSITFMKALESIRSFDPKRAEFIAWLYRIARNTLIDYYRTSSRSTSVDIESVWDLASSDFADAATEQSIDAVALHKALSTLSPKQREIVLLRFWEGLSFKEIATIAGTTEAASKMHVSRALTSLRTELSLVLLLFLFPQTL